MNGPKRDSKMFESIYRVHIHNISSLYAACNALIYHINRARVREKHRERERGANELRIVNGGHTAYHTEALRSIGL